MQAPLNMGFFKITSNLFIYLSLKNDDDSMYSTPSPRGIVYLNYLFYFSYEIQPEGVVIFFLLLGCTTASIV